MQVSNKTVFISGGGSGLGEACAHHFAALGAKIAIFDRNQAQAQAVAKACHGKAYQGDVCSEHDIEQAIASLQQAGESIHIVINCAGIAPAKKIIGREGAMPLADFKHVIDVNLIGTFNVMRLVATAMAKNSLQQEERGVIINTASIAAFEGQVGQAAYAASKGAVAAMTLPAARELARHAIRVMTIAPGIFATPMMNAMPQNVQDSLAEQIPFPSRLGQPQEYAKLAQAIVENPMLNGSTIRLDGAMRMAAK